MFGDSRLLREGARRNAHNGQSLQRERRPEVYRENHLAALDPMDVEAVLLPRSCLFLSSGSALLRSGGSTPITAG